MEKSKSKNSYNKINKKEIEIKETKEMNKTELKNVLIKEIDRLIIDLKTISKELIVLSNNLEINNLNDILSTSQILNNMLEISMNKLNNQMNKLHFLNKKRNNNEKEDKKPKINCKICEYNDKFGNIIGYNIKCEIMDKDIIIGPWNRTEVVKKVENKFIRKLSELNLDKETKPEDIDKFYEEFKNMIYIKYPPIKLLE